MSAPLVESFQVAATLLAQRIVEISGDDSVQYHATITTLPLGITKDTVLDTSTAIPVQLEGRAFLFFNDTVAAGGLVTADSSGRGVPFTAVTASTAYVGQLLGPAVAATGTIAEVLINPGFRNIP